MGLKNSLKIGNDGGWKTHPPRRKKNKILFWCFIQVVIFWWHRKLYHPTSEVADSIDPVYIWWIIVLFNHAKNTLKSRLSAIYLSQCIVLKIICGPSTLNWVKLTSLFPLFNCSFIDCATWPNIIGWRISKIESNNLLCF